MVIIHMFVLLSLMSCLASCVTGARLVFGRMNV